MWTRDSWPAVPHTSPDISNSHASISKPAVIPSVPEKPLYGATPEYDAKNMPKIPTVVANPNALPAPTAPTAPAKFPSGAVSVAVPAYVNPALDPKRVALIIETRPAPVLPALLAHMISVLPPQWVVKMVGTNESFAPILSSRTLGYHIKSTKLQLVNLPGHYPMTSQETVSQTLTNITFYRDFMAPAEWILMFQTDSIMCAASDQTVDDWVDRNYSWVGAPWFADVYGGNGGLSLRNVSAIVSLLEREERPVGYRQWEDMWLSEKLGESAAIGADEVSFSVESMYYETPLGYHLRGSGTLLDATIWANGTRKRQILEYCPEVKIVLGDMQMPKPNQTEARLEEQRLDENVWRKEQGLPLRLSPSQSSKLAEESMSKAKANAATAKPNGDDSPASVTKSATPEQSAGVAALNEAKALASAASLSPAHNSAYLEKEAEASKLMLAAAAAQSTQTGEGRMTAMPVVNGGIKAVDNNPDGQKATSTTPKSEAPTVTQPPTQQGIKELEGNNNAKGGYQPVNEGPKA